MLFVSRRACHSCPLVDSARPNRTVFVETFPDTIATETLVPVRTSLRTSFSTLARLPLRTPLSSEPSGAYRGQDQGSR